MLNTTTVIESKRSFSQIYCVGNLEILTMWCALEEDMKPNSPLNIINMIHIEYHEPVY